MIELVTGNVVFDLADIQFCYTLQQQGNVRMCAWKCQSCYQMWMDLPYWYGCIVVIEGSIYNKLIDVVGAWISKGWSSGYGNSICVLNI